MFAFHDLRAPRSWNHAEQFYVDVLLVPGIKWQRIQFTVDQTVVIGPSQLIFLYILCLHSVYIQVVICWLYVFLLVITLSVSFRYLLFAVVCSLLCIFVYLL